MDQGLKERLVGGAVLLAIAVWLIPWVLDGPESPLDTGSSALKLPAAEEPMPMRTQTLRLGDTADPDPATAASTATEQPVASAGDAGVSREPSDAPAADEPEPQSQRVPAPTVTVAAPPPPKPAATAAASTAITTPSTAGAWVVQLGSFAEEANARKVVERVRGFGYQAAISNVRSGGRTLFRVRVGPLVTRGEADAAASALVAHGVQARVVPAD